MEQAKIIDMLETYREAVRGRRNYQCDGSKKITRLVSLKREKGSIGDVADFLTWMAAC